MTNICVFCGSSQKVSDRYKAQARDLGAMIAAQRCALVYGGAQIGLMGAVANAALESGGDVIGVIPEHLKSKEIVHDGLTTLHVTQTMQERQKKMADLADAFVVLPGGLGTLAELFEVLTWRSLGLHEKPIYLLNIDQYWTPLLETFNRMQNENFLYDDMQDILTVIDNLDALKPVLKQSCKA